MASLELPDHFTDAEINQAIRDFYSGNSGAIPRGMGIVRKDSFTLNQGDFSGRIPRPKEHRVILFEAPHRRLRTPSSITRTIKAFIP